MYHLMHRRRSPREKGGPDILVYCIYPTGTLCTGVGPPGSREGRVGPDPRRRGVGAAHLITLRSRSGRMEGLT